MNNLPVEYKDGVFDKVKGFFRKLFGKEIVEIQDVNYAENVINNEEPNGLDKFKVDLSKKEEIRADGFDRIKADVERQRREIKVSEEEERKRAELVEEIKNSNIDLSKWPKEKLERLEKFYDEEIEKVNREIEALEERT